MAAPETFRLGVAWVMMWVALAVHVTDEVLTGFLPVREGILHKHTVFPNLGMPEPQDVYCYAQMLDHPHAV